MAKPSYQDLKDRIAELEQENDDLNDQLDQVADIVAPEEDEDGGDGDGDGDGDDDAGGD